MSIPKYSQLFDPTLHALRDLGGSASIQELEDEVSRLLNLSDDELAETHPDGRPVFSYRLAWARSYLKAYGAMDNSERGVWSLTPAGMALSTVDADEVRKKARSMMGRKKGKRKKVDEAEGIEEGEEWREQLLTLLRGLQPDKFERLCQRLLRESGFSEVEVTGRSGDGGIDGTGIVKLGGMLGFPTLFQCKRYSGSVGPGVVRDFRGAMVGRVDRGLIISTGVFTREARREASREGAPPIDLVDGESLLDKLRELRLGLAIETVEHVTVNNSWFESL